jgi:hypothetical protein
MTEQHPMESDPRVQAALLELQDRISGHYPTATFAVYRGEDPDGVYLRATVDVEDTDELLDVFIDRLVDLQVDEGLPVYVITTVPLERVAEQLRVRKDHRRPFSLPHLTP